MFVNQFLSADVKTWVKTLHTDSWVRLQKEMIEHYVYPLDKNRAWNLELPQYAPINRVDERLLGDVSPVNREGW
jgi:hypothetical protein